MYAFEATDLFKAKDVLGDRICIKGGVPISILAAGTPEDVSAYCKKIIDYVGRDGGFVLSTSTSVEDAKTDNIRAMFDFTRGYSGSS